jgi:hypothetical protein
MGLGVGRTLVGVYELVTFPLPNGSDYAPVLEPGTPFSAERTERFLARRSASAAPRNPAHP